jgi:hypothetical protein
VCPPLGERPWLRFPPAGAEAYTLEASELVWSCQYRYRLAAGVFLPEDATLRIGAGTVIVGDPDAFLLSPRGSQVLALGSRDAPIVFTSAAPPGERKPLDWRGIVLIGSGPTHDVTGVVPQLGADTLGLAEYGGGPDANAEVSCGQLEYVRVEFAGASLDSEDEPESALTLAGCGSGTRLSYVQVHRATDGIGLYGGSPRLDHVLSTHNAQGDGLEWTRGFRGSVQFLIVQNPGGGAGLRGANSASDADAVPRSRPTIYNATIVSSAAGSTDHQGIALRHGTSAEIRNSLVVGFSRYGLNIESSVSASLVEADRSGTPWVPKTLGTGLIVSHNSLFGNALGPFPKAGADDDDNGFDEYGFFMYGNGSALWNVVSDPKLVNSASLTAPDFSGTDVSFQWFGAGAPPSGIEFVPYRGAVRNHAADWTLGWTAFVMN